MKKLRIAFVTTNSDSMGGSHVHVRDVSLNLIREGHDVRVFVGGNGPYVKILQDLGVPVTSLRNMVRPIAPHKDVAAVGELARALKQFRPDLVSSHSSKAGIVARLASKIAKVPVIFTAHGWSFADGIPNLQRRIFETCERIVAPMTAKIICVAEEDRLLGIEKRIADGDRMITIHNGMPDSPERADPSQVPVRIVSVARLDKQKDHPTLFRALATMKEKPWELALVGGGPRQEELSQLAKELGIEERVTFHGTTSNVKPILASSQIFALISNWEGFPRSTLEAMRTGLPVIVSDVGGSKEAFVEGESGFAVPRGDVDAVAQTLAKMIDDAELRASMGVRARARFEELFTFEIMFERTKQIYAEVLRSAKSTR